MEECHTLAQSTTGKNTFALIKNINVCRSDSGDSHLTPTGIQSKKSDNNMVNNNKKKITLLSLCCNERYCLLLNKQLPSNT